MTIGATMTLQYEDLNKYAKIFNIRPDFINLAPFFDAHNLDALNKKGFVILHDVIPCDQIDMMRNNWLAIMKSNCSMTTDLMLGQKNYVHHFFGRYFRSFDFYWNAPYCSLSREISLLLHYARNMVTGYDPMYGLTYQPDSTGVYLAVTHYPSGTGEMAIHVDPNYFLPIHYNVPLTFKGVDYEQGGLYMDINGQHVDVETLVRPGSVILFNGSVPHGIAKVEGYGTRGNIGRMQMFSIPTQFTQKKSHGIFRELLWDVYGRAKYLGYQLGMGHKSDHKNFR